MKLSQAVTPIKAQGPLKEAIVTNQWLSAIYAEMQKQTALLTQLASQQRVA